MKRQENKEEEESKEVVVVVSESLCGRKVLKNITNLPSIHFVFLIYPNPSVHIIIVITLCTAAMLIHIGK